MPLAASPPGRLLALALGLSTSAGHEQLHTDETVQLDVVDDLDLGGRCDLRVLERDTRT